MRCGDVPAADSPGCLLRHRDLDPSSELIPQRKLSSSKEKTQEMERTSGQR